MSEYERDGRSRHQKKVDANDAELSELAAMGGFASSEYLYFYYKNQDQNRVGVDLDDALDLGSENPTIDESKDNSNYIVNIANAAEKAREDAKTLMDGGSIEESTTDGANRRIAAYLKCR